MKYDHRYHAGNAADCLKHLALALALAALTRKDSPLCYVETHAGAGQYRLEPGGEAQAGIQRLWPKRRELEHARPWLDAVAANGGERLDRYPGSPLIASRLLRQGDRMVLFESQEGPLVQLRKLLADRPNTAIDREDGYRGLPGAIPPRERRGLVLIDPPFEARDEWQRLTDTLLRAVRKWPQGTYLAWYPIKARGVVTRFHASLRSGGLAAHAVELMQLPEDQPERLNGSGLVVVNPPWRFLPALLGAAAEVGPLLADPREGRWAVHAHGWSAA